MYSMAHAGSAAEHSVLTNTKGFAEPDGPILRRDVTAAADTIYELPAASVVVIRGQIGAR
jgi:hypothetical protein